MNLLVLSDLHLERRSFSASTSTGRIDEHADVVVLAGDIHQGVLGIRWARDSFPGKPIIYVAGNHEFYDHRWDTLIDQLRTEARIWDVDFLECDAVELFGVRFLGATLWTDFSIEGEDHQSECMHRMQSCMSDYQFIRASVTPETYHLHSRRRLLPQLVLSRHQSTKFWIQRQLIEPTNATATVVVTHHAPSKTSLSSTFSDLFAPAYASDLDALVGQAQIWIHGHVHQSCHYQTVPGSGMGLVVSNPRGYWLGVRWENAHFNPSLMVQVCPSATNSTTG